METSTISSSVVNEANAMGAATVARPRMRTDSAQLLAQWQYVEYSALRVLTGWGRDAQHWEDKLAMCYHTWLQAENVDKMRGRLKMFPGNPDAPVHGDYERALNALFLAPSWLDAMAGLHEVLYPALESAYEGYIAASHPVHDKPTHDILRQIVAAREVQNEWYQSLRSREKQVDHDYLARVRNAFDLVGQFKTCIVPQEPHARPCGKFTDFLMNAAPGKVPEGDRAPNLIPLLESNWNNSVEARRLFFMIGYMWEMGVAEMQLRWLFYADFMPWEFIHDEARHMWDESRHGNSGRTRLQAFGLDIRDVGYTSYGAANAIGKLPAMTPHDVYQAFYNVTQVAETGYFKTKGYSFEDFRDGGDEASAEMMQFDIIDETSHTEYGRVWLEEMMKRAGVAEDYRARGLKDRQEANARAGERMATYSRYLETGELPQDVATPASEQKSVSPGDSASPAQMCQVLTDPLARAHYEKLLQVLREKCPLTNAQTAPIRPHLPM